jgi:hypothetical protein
VDFTNPALLENASAKTITKREAKHFLMDSAALSFICELAGVSAATMRKAALARSLWQSLS